MVWAVLVVQMSSFALSTGKQAGLEAPGCQGTNI